MKNKTIQADFSRESIRIRLVLQVMLFCFSSLVYAQNKGHVVIDGNVYVNNKPISSVDVKLYLRDQEIKHTRSLNNGNFQVLLNFNEKYNLEISKFGLVTKKFVFNTEIPDGEREDQIYLFPLQLDLFPPFEEVDISLLNEPMATIKFDKLLGTFGFDIEEATETVRKVRALQKEIENILEVKAKLFKLEYDNAELAYKQRNYKLAKDDYQKALKVYPVNSARLYIDVDYINNRIKTIDQLIADRDEKENAKALKKAYDDAISKADRAFERKFYDEAIENYTRATEVKPDEHYPKKKLDKINEIVTKNIVITLISTSNILKNGTETKLSFTPIKPYLKKGNYLLVKIMNRGDENTKVYVKFGKNKETSGGFVLKNLSSEQARDHFIRISANDSWFRLDANWISLYPEGGDVEVTEVKLSRTE